MRNYAYINCNDVASFLFCIVFDLLTFPLQEKIGCISTIKTKSELFILYCLRFAYFSLAGRR